MTSRSILGSLLSLLALAACTTISDAPEGSPRIETEVVTRVAQGIHEVLSFTPSHAAEERFGEVVSPMSDLGLRFYAVSTETYEMGHERPDYLFTIELSDVTLVLEEEAIELEDGQEQLTTHLESLSCTVTATLERRREHAPAMVIGRTEGSSELTVDRIFETERPPVNMIPLRNQPATGETLEVREDDFTELIERAAVRALKELEKPVDREFGLLRRPANS